LRGHANVQGITEGGWKRGGQNPFLMGY